MNHKSQTLSIVLITHNNRSTIEQTLQSASWADELIVMDRGSTDGTIEIIRQFTSKLSFTPFKHLSMIRRDALSLATSDWSLLLEGNERVEEMLRHEIDGVLLNNNHTINGYQIPRVLSFQNTLIRMSNGNVQASPLRLVRKGCWQLKGSHTDDMTVMGKTAKLFRTLHYEPYRTIDDLFMDVNRCSTQMAIHYLSTVGQAGKRPSLFRIFLKTKLASWKYFLASGYVLQGALHYLVAMANTMTAFLMWFKIRALLKEK